MPTTSEAGTCSLEEAARRIGIGRSTAYLWLRDGEFPVPVLKIKNRRLVRVAELERWLNGETA